MNFAETETTELKRILNDTFEKALVAFLNTMDGVIYIGVEDNGEVIGVESIDKMQKEISDIITTRVLPNPQDLVELGSVYVDGKNVIKVTVRKGNALYYIKKYGRSAQGCYIRIGTSCRSMTEEQIEKGIVANKKHVDEMILTESSNQNLTFRKLRIYYEEKNYHLNDETFAENLGLLTADKKYNRLAELLADTNRVSLKIARFAGEDKSVLLEKTDYGYTCLLVAMDKMLNRLEVENYTMSVIGGATRQDKRLIDKKALREAFINAIAHNDWQIVEPAVYIFSNRIEIISHGGLPIGETVDMFFKGISTPRNNALMRVLSDLEYVEQTGHGIPNIIGKYGRSVFDIEADYINVTLPFDKEVLASHAAESSTINSTINSTIKLSKTESDILEFMKKDERITGKSLAEKLNKDLSTIRKAIKKLQGNGIIRRIGSNKSGYWEILI